MKNFLLILAAALLVSCSMPAANQEQPEPEKPESEASNFELYPTKNMWNFLKLDTRNGKVWQVQYSLEDDQLEVDLNPASLDFENKNMPGRFSLYPTQNMYNFILLDEFSGHTYQVQWSIDEEKRMILPIS